jgi:methylated-DNA-[protein]-cysteine S-methyltransferase
MDVFPSSLGWIALVTRGETVEQLVFGFASPDEAVRAIDEAEFGTARAAAWNRRLVKRLQAYADGGGDDFRDVKVLEKSWTPFQRDVLKACRRIPYGRTLCYSELADAAGYPRAARAVGNVMANNCLPLIVPCHRVLAAGGRLGGYSNRLGLAMKKRLLALEAANPGPQRRAARHRS